MQAGLHSSLSVQYMQKMLHVACCRRAYELAFATAYMFAGQRPTFKEVDEVTFMRPVDVGDLLKFRSCIIHTMPSASDADKVT